MVFKATQNSFTALDLRRLQEEVKRFPAGTSRLSISKDLSKVLKKAPEILERWLQVSMSFSSDIISRFERGEINRERLNMIAKCRFTNPSWKTYLAEKVIEEGIREKEFIQVRNYIYAGRHPKEAIDIVKGRQSEKPITRNEELTLGKIVRDIEQTGLSWRKSWEFLKSMGKIQILQNGSLRAKLIYDILAMKVACEDVRRFVDEMAEDIPKDMMEAIRAEITGKVQEPVMEDVEEGIKTDHSRLLGKEE